MAWDSQTITSPSLITGMRPCGFIARNSGVSSPPKPLPSSICPFPSPRSTSSLTADRLMHRPRGDQGDEITTHRLAKLDVAPVCEFVLARGAQHQAVFAEGNAIHAVGQRVLGAKPQIGGARGDGVPDLAAFAL